MSVDLQFKSKCKKKLLDMIQSNINELESIQRRLYNDKSDETKSVVGDKYETSRAMVQMEEDQIKHKIGLFHQKYSKVKMLDTSQKLEVIGPGAIVKMEIGSFYISVAEKSLIIENNKVYFISPESPLAVSLRGKVKDTAFEFNGRKLKVLDIS